MIGKVTFDGLNFSSEFRFPGLDPVDPVHRRLESESVTEPGTVSESPTGPGHDRRYYN